MSMAYCAVLIGVAVGLVIGIAIEVGLWRASGDTLMGFFDRSLPELPEIRSWGGV